MKLLLNDRAATPGGWTVNVAVFVEKTPRAATIGTAVFAETAFVVTENVAALAPDGTVTLAGTVAAGFWLESVMTYPPDGAGPLMDTFPVDPTPPATIAGFSASEINAGGRTVRVAVLGARLPIHAEIVTDTVPGTTLGFVATGLVKTTKVEEIAPG